MGKAAVPQYLGDDFGKASPGLRFTMYLEVWNGGENASGTGGNRRVNPREEGIGKWRRDKKANRLALKNVAPLGEGDHKSLLDKLIARQREMAQQYADALRVDAVAITPFTTGLGNEHPLENGFAFLWPYGLPYLPGSGVKGVLRQAARELREGVWGDAHGWDREAGYRLSDGTIDLNLSVVDILFGRETGEGERDHVRGVLAFWDVYPSIKDGKLLVEILNPHYTDYYQQPGAGTGPIISPHDTGQPVPNLFLTVPPESHFHFVVTCDTVRLRRLAPDLAEPGAGGRPAWQALLAAAFELAFEWLGFGAKTSVGYGAMRKDVSNPPATDRGGTPRAATVSESRTEVWEDATLEYRPDTGAICATHSEKGRAEIPSDQIESVKRKIREKLGEEKFARLKKRRKLERIKVCVRRKGNMIELVDLCD